MPLRPPATKIFSEINDCACLLLLVAGEPGGGVAADGDDGE